MIVISDGGRQVQARLGAPPLRSAGKAPWIAFRDATPDCSCSCVRRLDHDGSNVFFSFLRRLHHEYNGVTRCLLIKTPRCRRALYHSWLFAVRHDRTRRGSVVPALASMAYQISGQARLSAAHGTQHASTPAGQADHCRRWQPWSQLSFFANHRQPFLHRRMIHLGADACFLEHVLTDAIGLRSRSAWGCGTDWPKGSPTWRCLRTPPHAGRSRNNSP